MSAESKPQEVVLIDAHVHLRHAHDPSAVLDGAMAHFDRHQQRLGARQAQRVLMLTESADEHSFERLCAQDAPMGAWIFEHTGEAESLRAIDPDGRAVLLVQGAQVRTNEGLEVLLLASSERLADDAPIRRTIEDALELEALVTLPWGFGKWTGARKRLMLAILSEFAEHGLALGDSAHRPEGFAEGAVFRKARALGMPILPGTDPLPIPAHVRRAGKYALWLEGGLDSRTPAGDLRERLRQPMDRNSVIGRRDGLFGSLYAQAALRLRSRNDTH